MTKGGTLTRAELRELLATARGRRHRAGAPYRHARRDALFLELLAIAGLRPGEATALRTMDLPPGPDDSRIWVNWNGKRRSVEIPWPLARRLWSYVSAEELPLEGRLFPFSVRFARSMFRLYAHRVGLRNVLSLDSLRGYAAAQAWRHGGGVLQVAARLGNASVSAAFRFISAIDAQPDVDRVAV